MAHAERAEGSSRSRDLLAGLAVAVVLIPQSLAYAELAGLPADRGLVTAAIAGIVGAVLGSSAYLQTGPTALASLLTFGILAGIADNGSERFIALAAVLAVLAGLIRVLIGVLKLGRVSYLISPPVISGLSTGAGILIVASQVPGFLGRSTDASNPVVALVGAVTLAVMIGGRRLGERVPSALLAVVAGIVTAQLVTGDVPAVELGVPALGIPLGEIQRTDIVNLIVPALVVAVIGFSEAASIARQLAASGRERWDASRELVGQGAACALAGLAGGFPTSGSFSRSALAKMSGARTRLAGAVAGAATLLVLPVTDLVPAIPRPTLAALVIVAGASLIDVGPLRRLRANTRLQFTVALLTLASTLVLAPRIDVAVLIGVLAAVGAHLFREEKIHVTADRRGHAVHVDVDGVLFYVSAPRLVDALTEVLAEHRDVDVVEIDLRGAGRIDVSGAVALSDALDDIEAIGVSVRIIGMTPATAKIMQRVLGDRLAPGEDPRTPSQPIVPRGHHDGEDEPDQPV